MTKPQYDVVAHPADVHVLDERIHIAIPVENRAERSLLVVDEIRSLDWDPAARRLHIRLRDRALAPSAACRLISTPSLRALPTGERTTIEVTVPRHMFRLTPKAGGDATVEELDFTGLAEVTIEVAVADAPFYVTAAAGPVHEQLASWGQVLAARGTVRGAPVAKR